MTQAVTKSKQYISKNAGCYQIQGKRVSLDSIVYLFRQGASPESIVAALPTLSLEEVYGSIAFYLGNQEIIDAYLDEGIEIFQQLQKQARDTNAELYQQISSTPAPEG
ncbi:DUF433 domain-containing protein [Thermosynechococcaceae cyanobacterium BACA0444]|uniref:DUF433 domain-containing protein n=1 Tax=Pseudocalidococcus azoricus BACA0444 TaxID=2918990 RepID=A0AAE4JVE8_9CYAN|nr:DUF433 domain-containing protein [Pseudocalidococcus azoricus]MDS3860280.1 DUF433 domain-containing protein [Pseudocalidococcus azoricus BACA0444]